MQANYANALCHRNATPLSVAVLVGETDKAKMGQCLGGGLLSLSLSFFLSLSRCLRFWHTFGLNLKGFFTHFIVVLIHLFAYKRHFLGHFVFLNFLNALFLGFLRLSLRAVCLKTADFVILSVATQRVARRKPQQKNPHKLKENLPFMDTSLALSMTANASLRAVFAKTADFVILSLLQKGEKSTKIKENLPFLDTSLTLSMTNSGFCLKITDIFTQILKQKFKFFTQNSTHFTNSTHFINLSQISSPTQGFFIFLPQVFAQCKLIKNFLQGGHCV